MHLPMCDQMQQLLQNLYLQLHLHRLHLQTIRHNLSMYNMLHYRLLYKLHQQQQQEQEYEYGYQQIRRLNINRLQICVLLHYSCFRKLYIRANGCHRLCSMFRNNYDREHLRQRKFLLNLQHRKVHSSSYKQHCCYNQQLKQDIHLQPCLQKHREHQQREHHYR